MEFSIGGYVADKLKLHILRAKDRRHKLQRAVGSQIDTALADQQMNVIKVAGSRSRIFRQLVLRHLLANRSDFLYREHRRTININRAITEHMSHLARAVLKFAEVHRKVPLLLWSNHKRLPSDCVDVLSDCLP